jgi:hypothetical protein
MLQTPQTIPDNHPAPNRGFVAERAVKVRTKGKVSSTFNRLRTPSKKPSGSARTAHVRQLTSPTSLSGRYLLEGMLY